MAEAQASYPSLKGRGVVVTGGASGIGRAVVEGFVEQGALVAVLDTDAESGKALEECHSDAIRFIPTDVSDTEKLGTAIDEAAKSFGRLDVLVANAANDSRHTVEELTPELWDQVMAVNLKHQFFAAKAALPHLEKNGGSVICMGSISWLNNTTGMPAYTVAKAGIHGLVRTLAVLWGKKKIRVNAVLPGWTMTERQQTLWVDAEAEQLMDEAQALPGRVMPHDIANAVLFLSSDEAAMITKQAIVVDAGWI
ncbi:(S)-1-Phenylethanol dehydrogenase [Methyloligella halotolerans]|uniref:(S)-1-Phenylethanol dehydrogenase n=1 Tax=Methyloligella halotolerans TaxID=1177755 RepID=A0A1E2S2X5_9HYPH|nr:SDR family NAD(P)-dependent oxidoreductase [Methyloligella halotolerans]ODA68675.1 (S)-1-Phenylethanol dehydrogenase [Methyloligella halotolerans]